MKPNTPSASKSTGLDKVRAAIGYARENLLNYAQLCDGAYVASAFHDFLSDELTAVATGKCRRLIINVPPRHGKSRMTTVELPTWMLGQDPTKKIVLTSYSGNLATKHSKESRSRLQLPFYQHAFPGTRLNPKDAGADEWSTTKGGIYKAVGIGGSLTGHGAQLLIVDDPFANFEEAHSPTTRESVWQWFWSTAYTRLSSDGAMIIIMTRWHQDDLVGRLQDPKRIQELKDAGIEDNEEWRLVNLPALAHDNDPMGRATGDALFPEKFPVNRLKAIRQVLGSYLWSAMYDGNPIPRGGNYVDASHFIVAGRDQVPAGLRWFRFWDLATSSKTMADFTAGVKGAFGPAPGAPDNWQENKDRWPSDYFYLADMIYGQWEWPRAREKIKSTAELERIFVGVEVVAGFKTGYANLREVMPADIALQDFGADRDKLTRALPWIALAEAQQGEKFGHVVLVAGDWITAFKSQVEAFPAGAFDDMVDAVSGVYNMLKSGREIFVA